MMNKMSAREVVLLFIASITAHCCLAAEYGIIVDAGSSGSRARIYTWPERTSLNQILQLSEVANKKIKPGLSAYAGDPTGLRNHIGVLLGACKENVPVDKQADTPFYIMATAGMRLLPGGEAFSIYQQINTMLFNKSFCPFEYKKGNARTLSGEEEGAFTWISANQLNGLFGESRTTNKIVGILEMGGASTQIAFVPERSVLADKFPVYVAGQYYPLYVHSYLYYGQNYAIQKVKDNLFRKYDRTSGAAISNPCMLNGDEITETMDGLDVTFIGTANADHCLEVIREELVYKVPDYQCYPKPCAIGQNYQPIAPKEMTFYAVSAFVYAVLGVGAVEENDLTTARRIEAKTREFCKLDIKTAINRLGRYANSRCLIGLYTSSLLTDGFGFGKDKKINVAGEIAEHDLTWAPGAMVYEVERRERGRILDIDEDSSSGESESGDCY
ncbi:unnamed protein product [Owenia fusiformis]|uniref:Uncharacterized protein n=1 Tax=Owenia fusiformis TaxID=6347 RepID=A0A8J1TLC2_OWEFU|nr:unnamed protein product [Owenia fusiformis]